MIICQQGAEFADPFSFAVLKRFRSTVRQHLLGSSADFLQREQFRCGQTAGEGNHAGLGREFQEFADGAALHVRGAFGKVFCSNALSHFRDATNDVPILLCSHSHAVAVWCGRMELRQLRYFATVARELNFTRAAAKLHVAQPALSRQVKQLEEELGVALLARNKRGVELTRHGISFLPEAEQILQQSERALERARGNGTGSLNIGYVWGLFHSTVPGILQRFRTLEPNISVHLFDMPAAEQGRALAQGKLDAGFIGLAFEAEEAGLAMERVGATKFVLALPKRHPCARHRAVDLRALEGEVFPADLRGAFSWRGAGDERGVFQRGFQTANAGSGARAYHSQHGWRWMRRGAVARSAPCVASFKHRISARGQTHHR
jgi:DNA-binding transcriptional LysR family regulator